VKERKMTSSIEEETNQTKTRTIDAGDLLDGKIPLDNLPEPYHIVMDAQNSV
jgi:hypothetical protein